MKRLTALFFVTALAVSLASAQWLKVDSVSGLGQMLGDISFSDTLNGWVVGYGDKIAHSTDGGRSWENVVSPITFRNFHAVYAEGNNVWIAGSSGYGSGPGIVLYSSDNGQTWQEQSHSAVNSNFWDIARFGNDLIIVGGYWMHSWDQWGLMLRSSDNGASWQLTEFPQYGGLRSISVVSDSVAWIAGINGAVLQTTNQGASWVNRLTDTTINHNHITFSKNGMRGYLTGVRGFTDVPLRTSDGGNTWIPWTPKPGFDIASVALFGEDVLYVSVNAFRVGGQIMKSTDGGVSYQPDSPLYPANEANTADCYFGTSCVAVDLQHIWFITGFGVLGYQASTPQPNTSPYFLTRLDTLSLSAGQDTTLYVDAADPGDTLYAVCGNIAPGMDVLPCVPSRDTLKLTVSARMNEGVYQASITVYDGSGAADTMKFWVKVQNSTAVHELKQLTPKTFRLEQNYPNPFNPGTMIRYSIPKAANVRLTVYNLIGQEIATLVDKHQPSGTYEADFNASKLPSGIYLYRLTAGTYTETKKMLLTK